MTDWDGLRFGLDAVVVLSVAANWLYTLHADRRRAIQAEIEALTERLVATEKRVSGHEVTIQNLPGHTAISDLTEKFSDLHGDLRAVAAELTGFKETFAGVNRIVNLMHEHLLRDR